MERGEGQHAERDIFNIGEIQGNVVVQNTVQVTRPRNEQILLRAIRDEVESRLAGSLHNSVFLTLDKEALPEQVKRLWDREIKVGTKPTTVIPDDISIVQVFDSPEVSGKLLILGQPGAGKTTTLLNLAKGLVEKAEADSSYPIPLLLNLASWQDESQPIREWMVVELLSKYGISSKLGEAWITERIVLPLLDGLDEVISEKQESCVKQINDFLEGEASPLYTVVCSRLAEYETYEAQLQLHGAIYLKALTHQQIKNYLIQVDRQDLWQFLARSSELLELVHTPLLLSMVVLACPKSDTEQWRQLETTSNQLQYLFDTYVEQMLNRSVESRIFKKSNVPNPQKTRLWLTWIAKQLETDSQVEFLIEQIQPSWLPAGLFMEYRETAKLASVFVFMLFPFLPVVILVTIPIALIVGLPLSLFRGFKSGLLISFYVSISLVFLLLLGNAGSFLAGSLILVLLSRTASKAVGQANNILLTDTLTWSWKSAIYGIIHKSLIGILLVVITGLLLKDILGGMFFGLFWLLINGLKEGVVHSEIKEKNHPNQGVIDSLKYGLMEMFALWLFCGLCLSVLYSIIYANIFLGVAAGICVGILTGSTIIEIFYSGNSERNGLYSGLNHLALRVVLCRYGCAPWNYERFLNYCTERLLIQRVGGRYRFIHKRLQEHFSGMPSKHRLSSLRLNVSTRQDTGKH
jgi:GTPase SAR1 family protein